MSYIEKSLGDGERLIARAHFHWLYVLAAVLALIVLGWILIGIWIFGAMMVRYYTTEIGITNHRFIMKTGWIRRDTQEIALDNIEGVQVHQSILGRIFGYGGLVVQGTGVDAVHLPKMLGDPVGFRRAIESARGDRTPPPS
jgi:uncharacterized membrane protein YdbT with pleckstrin-like domain